MTRSGPVTLGILVLSAGMLAAAAACTQPEKPTAALRATNTPDAAPTTAPTDRSVPPPDVPTETPTPASTVPPTGASGPESTPQPASAAGPAPTSQSSDVPFDCAGLSPTNTPDPNRPDGIPGMSTEFWNVSSFEEAECYAGYPIAVPTHLPDDFVRSETIVVNKMGTSDWEDVFVEHGWIVSGDPPYGFRLSQHTRKFSLGNGEPAVIDGVPGERQLDPARSPDFPEGLTLLWKRGDYWFTVFGFLHGPVTEEFLLKVAASLQFPVEDSG